MEGIRVPPGFRFYPTEEELVGFYLSSMINGTRRDLMPRLIPILDIYDFSPWELPQYSGELCHGDPVQWFFFIPRQESEARGGKPRRLTASGYWKATGSPGHVYTSEGKVIGVKRTMVFYSGRSPSGTKTEWKMNEYKAIGVEGEASPSNNNNTVPKLSEEFSLCRLYKQSKSLRAFDRRPSMSPGLAMAGSLTMTSLQQHHISGDPSTACQQTQQNPPSMQTQERAGLADGSSSSDDEPPLPCVGESSMAIYKEQLQESKFLDWFDEPQ